MKRKRSSGPAKLSEAVFLGRKRAYTFDVYPLTAEIPEVPAVFIVSRRKVSRSGRASHAASCIGETESMLAELKKHRRAKCVKLNESNVVCVLRDENGRNRMAVLSDITEARTFGCVRNVYEPTIMRRPDVLHIAAAKHADSKPARRRKIEEPEPDEAPVKQARRKRASAPEVVEKPKAKPKTKAKAEPIRKTRSKAKPARKVRAKTGPAREVKATAKPDRKDTASGKPSHKTSLSSGKSKAPKPISVKPKATNPKSAQGKVTKPVRSAAFPAAASAKRTSTSARTVSAKRTKPAAKPAKPEAKTPKPAAKAKKTAAKAAKPAARPAEQPAAAKAKRTAAAAKPRARISGGVDSDRGKHRLPEQKRPARGRAKAGAAKRAGTRKKAAA